MRECHSSYKLRQHWRHHPSHHHHRHHYYRRHRYHCRHQVVISLASN